MRRLLLTALVAALLVGAFAGVASARLSGDDAPRRPARAAAPFDVPAAAPRADRSHPGTYGFRSSEAIAAEIAGRGGHAAAAPGGTGGASGSVVVSATVLPVVFIVLDERAGRVQQLFTNTSSRVAADVLFIVRVGDVQGAAAPLTARTWAAARGALQQAHAGTGVIWDA